MRPTIPFNSISSIIDNHKERPAFHVLIEGLDYAGKSTVTAALEQQLKKIHLNARVNRGGLYQGWIARHASQVNEYRGVPRYYINFIFTLVPIIDWLRYKPRAGEVVIQETYANRMVAFQKVHRIRFFPTLIEWLMPRLQKFDIVIFLTVGWDERLRRFQEREKRNENDEVILKMPDRFIETNEELCHQIKHHPFHHIIDTSVLPLDDVVDLIVVLILERMKETNASLD